MDVGEDDDHERDRARDPHDPGRDLLIGERRDPAGAARLMGVELIQRMRRQGEDDRDAGEEPNDSNYYSLPLGRMARTEAPHNQERRPRRTDGRGQRRTVAETIGREGRREELGNLVVSRWGARRRWAHA